MISDTLLLKMACTQKRWVIVVVVSSRAEVYVEKMKDRVDREEKRDRKSTQIDKRWRATSHPDPSVDRHRAAVVLGQRSVL